MTRSSVRPRTTAVPPLDRGGDEPETVYGGWRTCRIGWRTNVGGWTHDTGSLDRSGRGRRCLPYARPRPLGADRAHRAQAPVDAYAYRAIRRTRGPRPHDLDARHRDHRLVRRHSLRR